MQQNDLTGVQSPFVRNYGGYWDCFASKGTCRTYPAKTVLYCQGEVNDCLFYVRKGTVKITILHANGAEKILAILGPGSLFGETFMDGYPHFAHAITTERSEILSFPKALIYKELESNPQVIQAFVMSVLRKLRLCALQIEDMTFRSAQSRVYHLVHQLADIYGVPHPRGKRIQIRITHQELGQITGTSRITANKVLNDLRRQGVIDLDKRWLVVLDEVALGRLAHRQDGHQGD